MYEDFALVGGKLVDVVAARAKKAEIEAFCAALLAAEAQS